MIYNLIATLIQIIVLNLFPYKFSTLTKDLGILNIYIYDLKPEIWIMYYLGNLKENILKFLYQTYCEAQILNQDKNNHSVPSIKGSVFCLLPLSIQTPFLY